LISAGCKGFCGTTVCGRSEWCHLVLSLFKCTYGPMRLLSERRPDDVGRLAAMPGRCMSVGLRRGWCRQPTTLPRPPRKVPAGDVAAAASPPTISVADVTAAAANDGADGELHYRLRQRPPPPPAVPAGNVAATSCPHGALGRRCSRRCHRRRRRQASSPADATGAPVSERCVRATAPPPPTVTMRGKVVARAAPTDPTAGRRYRRPTLPPLRQHTVPAGENFSAAAALTGSVGGHCRRRRQPRSLRPPPPLADAAASAAISGAGRRCRDHLPLQHCRHSQPCRQKSSPPLPPPTSPPADATTGRHRRCCHPELCRRATSAPPPSPTSLPAAAIASRKRRRRTSQWWWPATCLPPPSATEPQAATTIGTRRRRCRSQRCKWKKAPPAPPYGKTFLDIRPP